MPEIDYVFFADAADARPGAKFFVLGGGVSRIGGPTFPLVHPHLAMVIGLGFTDAEAGAPHQMRFVLTGPDGRELSRAEAEVRAEGVLPGHETHVTFAIDLWNLTFDQPGEYSLRVFVGGSERKRVPLTVERSSGPPGTAVVPPFPPPPGRA
jgi:hypothetical protein